MKPSEQLRALIALAEKATPGYEYDGRGISMAGVNILLRNDGVGPSHSDAAYIAACSPDKLIPLLTAAAEAMEREEKSVDQQNW